MDEIQAFELMPNDQLLLQWGKNVDSITFRNQFCRCSLRTEYNPKTNALVITLEPTFAPHIVARMTFLPEIPKP